MFYFSVFLTTVTEELSHIFNFILIQNLIVSLETFDKVLEKNEIFQFFFLNFDY